MMETLRNWLLGITAAAMILTIADSLSPEGAVKRIGKLAGGLLLVVVILKPILGVDYQTMAAAWANYRFENVEYSSALEVENERLKKIIIEDRTGAYIQDRAKELGIDCTVEVSCRTNEEGMFFPDKVVIRSDLEDGEIESLKRMIEGEVAIPTENQRYEGKNTP